MSNLRKVVLPEVRKPGKRLGRHVEHDARSFAFAAPMALTPLKSVDWTRHCDPFDQGDLGSCTGNAMAGALMTEPLYIAGRELGEADAVSLYEMATTLDNIMGSYPPDDTGSSGVAVAKAARKKGMISVFHHAFSLSAALHALSKGPVIAGISWFEGFDSPEGDAAELKISGVVRGGHEICLDGIDVENGYVKGTNSWGINWGNRGCFVMSFGTLRQLLKDDGDITVPVK